MSYIKGIALKASALAIAASTFAAPQSAFAQDTPFLGQISLYPYGFCPRGWTETNGQLLQISSYTALFSLLGTNFGGDGRITFGLPDLRSRSPVGIGQGPGMSNIQLGQKGGREAVTANIGTMAAHSHGATTNVTVNSQLHGYSSRAGNTTTVNGNVPASSPEAIYNAGPADADMGSSAITNSATATTTVANAGGNQSENIRNPYLGLRWCIALEGVYPSRN